MNRMLYYLLRCIRSLSVLDIYLGLDVHTEITVAVGRAELANFKFLVKVCVSWRTIYFIVWNLLLLWLLCQRYASKSDGSKNWDFPKIHWIEHAFDDIEAKGVTRNYNTKPNEKLHGPLKKCYLKTNFKNVTEQVHL